MGINVQVCWEKFCRYWDVEPRYAMMEGDRRHLTAETAVPLCDENTIGVVAVLGSTQDGSYEPVAAIADALQALQDGGGPDVPLHVDAASAASSPRSCSPTSSGISGIDRVVSINTSGHKYGLVYPGVGWVVWRDREALPAELIFEVNYLGGSMPTFALNFSRSGSNVIAQYYQLIRLGFEGYRRVQQSCQDTAMHLSAQHREDRSVPAAHRRERAAGLRVHRGPGRGLQRLRRLRRAAQTWLAGSRVLAVRQPREHLGAPRRGSQRILARPVGPARSTTSSARWPSSSTTRRRVQHPHRRRFHH